MTAQTTGTAPALDADDRIAPIAFDNSYARLPERFFARQWPSPVTRPRLIRLNAALAHELQLDLDWLGSTAGIAMLAGSQVPAGADPIAAAYAGHQFGGFSPQLGDGRALLLGEVIDRHGAPRDIQLKGSGPTPFSRRGDGRVALGPVLREYIISEAMAALGVPTTRALAAVTTGDIVQRETPLPGGVFTRIAASHIRVGTFQYFAARDDVDALRILTDYVVARHYPEVSEAPSRALALLGAVVARQAALVAQWMLIGFIHGVMNTDNCSIAGETIDYGPCAFMDSYHPNTVYSSIDHHGRYAYANQPAVALWNMTRFAETLLPLIADTTDTAIPLAQSCLETFAPAYAEAYVTGARRKLGLFEAHPDDRALMSELLEAMDANDVDFTLLFRDLGASLVDAGIEADIRARFSDPATFDVWNRKWRSRLALETVTAEDRRLRMEAVNPAFIPRNHLVEQAIAAGVIEGQFKPFEDLLDVLARPYTAQANRERYGLPPERHEIVRATFCGT